MFCISATYNDNRKIRKNRMIKILKINLKKLTIHTKWYKTASKIASLSNSKSNYIFIKMFYYITNSYSNPQKHRITHASQVANPFTRKIRVITWVLQLGL